MDGRRPFLYLLTGVLVSVLGQKITNARMFLFRAHLIPVVKFMSTLLVGMASGGGSMMRHKVSARQRRLMVGMGLLDTMAYAFFCVGFGYCGSDATALILPAMGQILTAFFSLVLLKKKIPCMRQIAVCLVFVGVVVKAVDAEKGRSLGIFADGTYFQIGLAYLVGASLCYSLLGVFYELLVMSGTKEFPVPPHTHIMLHSSVIGSFLSIIFQIGYVFPRWDELIGRPLAASGVHPIGCILWLVSFGMSYQVHSYAQGLTFKSDGALGVQLVNAVRGSVTNVVASLAFCRHEISECLSVASICSGMLTATGGILWTLATRKQKNE